MKTKLKLLLKEQADKSVSEQQSNREIIIDQFREFWKLNPTIAEFKDATQGLVLFPELIYIMTKEGNK